MLVSCYTALGDGENARRAARIALERAEKAVAQDRSNGFAMGVGVGALAALGETERAKEWMNRALLIDPDNLLMRYNFACALATSLNDPDAALDMLGPVLERDPGGMLRWQPERPGLRQPARRSPLPGHDRRRRGAAGGGQSVRRRGGLRVRATPTVFNTIGRSARVH